MMMNENEEILESLISGGLIGAALGALISSDKSGTGLGALAGAALFATYAANEKARKTKIPLVIERNGAIYEIQPDGTMKFIKSIPKNTKKVPKKFRLQ
jgi:hypothetical protein